MAFIFRYFSSITGYRGSYGDGCAAPWHPHGDPMTAVWTERCRYSKKNVTVFNQMAVTVLNQITLNYRHRTR